MDESEDYLLRYFQLLVFVFMYVFIFEGVEVVVYEIYYGGEYDVMNVIVNFIIIIVIFLGMDYVWQFGLGIENIVWYKVGIFKCGVDVFLVEQDDIFV